MSKVAVVLDEDRHTGPQLFVFTDTAKAIEWAKARAREHACCTEFEEFMAPYEDGDGMVYDVQYCIEGDRISVTQCEVDAELEVGGSTP